MRRDETYKSESSSKKWLIFLIILLLIGVVSIYFVAKNTNILDDTFVGLVMDKDSEEGGRITRTEEEIIADLNAKVEEGMINISMNTNPIFPTGNSKGNLMIINEEKNNYPQIVEIYLRDTEHLIYKSDGIPVGSKIEESTLDKYMPKGLYKCTAFFHNVDETTGESLGKAGANIEIEILK